MRTERMNPKAFIDLGIRIFKPDPLAIDVLLLLNEAQRAREAELTLLAILKGCRACSKLYPLSDP